VASATPDLAHEPLTDPRPPAGSPSAKGFSRVADLQGGYDAWASAGLPVDRGVATT
jgi:hypothetical protein